MLKKWIGKFFTTFNKIKIVVLNLISISLIVSFYFIIKYLVKYFSTTLNCFTQPLDSNCNVSIAKIALIILLFIFTFFWIKRVDNDEIGIVFFIFVEKHLYVNSGYILVIPFLHKLITSKTTLNDFEFKSISIT